VKLPFITWGFPATSQNSSDAVEPLWGVELTRFDIILRPDIKAEKIKRNITETDINL
jgi:hypothetical protein